MPKVIEKLESKLIEEARRQIEQQGYGAVTIRSVAAACGVGVGTVYNYFSSKDELLATYMLSDWNDCISAVVEASEHSQKPSAVALCMYEQLCGYAQKNRAVFSDTEASTHFSGSFSRYHSMLRAQLAQPLRRFCETDFAAEFIAEAILTWTMAGKSFSEIYGMIDKLFKE